MHRHFFVHLTALLLSSLTAIADVSVTELELRNPPQSDSDGLVVTWMGTTTLIISDGETNLITDGYFTRVPLAFPPVGMPEIEPNRELVEHYIKKLQLDSAAAVMVVHSHFDHALDAPIVAELTGATLLGSESTANIGRGLRLPEEQIRVVTPGESMQFGDFEVTFIPSKHWRLPESLAALGMNKTIDQPLVPPAPYIAYREGKTYSILLEHPRGNILVQGSAGFVPGALQGLKADYVMLSTGGLGDLEAAEQEDYFREIVTTTGAKTVFPIHWDTMVTPLDEPLVPDQDFQRAMSFMERKRTETGVTYQLLPLGEAVQFPSTE